MHLHLVCHEGEDDVLRHDAQEAEQAHVCSKHHVAPAELPPEIQIHGGALARDQEYLQQEAAGFTLHCYLISTNKIKLLTQHQD